MELPFDILDHIFSFLKSHPKALLACSKAHPILSQTIERHRFHRIIIHTGTRVADYRYGFKPSDLLKHVTETPRITKYVAILQIGSNDSNEIAPYLEEIASLLPMFPLLECIVLPTHPKSALLWQNLPQSFRTAVENCLHLPTLQEVHVGNLSFPLSLLDDHPNINSLSLSGPPKGEPEYLETTYPQIKSLSFEGFEHHYSNVVRTWAKRHILELQSLKYDLSCHRLILEVLQTCSNTLENLYLCLQRRGTPLNVDIINLSSLPHLRHLTILAECFFEFDSDEDDTIYHSYLPKAVEILKTASSPLQQLTIEIFLDPCWGGFDHLNLSPLEALTTSSVCFHHADLYIHTGEAPKRLPTHTEMSSLLAKYEGLVKWVEEGVLVVHLEETAPTLFRSYLAPSCNCSCIVM